MAQPAAAAFHRKSVAIALIAPCSAGLAAVVVLAGWAFDRPAWRGQIGGGLPMMPSTACTVLLASGALLLLRREQKDSRRHVGRLLAVLVLIAGAWGLCQPAGAPGNLDHLVFGRLLHASGAPAHWAMAMGSAFSFVLLGTALLGLDDERLRRAMPPLALSVAGIALMVLIAAAYGVHRDAAAGPIPMSVLSAAALLALSAGVVAARPERQPLAILACPGPGGVLARRLVPLSLLGLPILGWLRIAGERLGLYDHTFGIALLIVAAAAVVCAVVTGTAVRLETSEDARRAAEATLRAQRSQLQAIFDNTSYVMFLKDLEGRYLVVNREFERVTGWSRQTAVGRTVFDLLPREAAAPIWDKERSAFEAGTSLTFEAVSSPLGDGPHTWLITVCPLRDADGAPTALCGIVHDISERKRHEEDLRRARDEAQAANRELEAFAYSVSHDLRAPLRHIGGFVDLLERHARAALDDTGRRHLGRIADAARRMGNLIDDLLSFSRMGRTELRRAEVDLAALVEEVRREVTTGIPDRRITFDIGPLPAVHGDPAMLRVVLTNLLSNAVKYTAPRAEARIEIRALQAAGETTILVRDNGVGFDPRYASRLFGVFQRLHRQEEFEGTGIGLANVQRIVARHGGRTWAEAAPDRGATFHFTLPESKEQAA
ncbi:MAG TPA: ATP-binding protein [Candidatus Polarisedimenticolia bacterium]|nr:ATP-binding protein [Candidatus Polarisedimenticolia bacterium]